MARANEPQIQRRNRDQSQSVQDAYEDYLAIEPTKHAHAHAEIMDFVTTANQWSDELSYWVTTPKPYASVITATPRWFPDLPEDVQSIKLEEGNAWASIQEENSISKSRSSALRETSRARLRSLAGIAVAAAVH
jgi:hypothetical protein